jgi:23S rRNA-/tRNA-specific pseudouridylate synthase
VTNLSPEQLKGLSANGLLANWFDELSHCLKRGEDPALRFTVTGDDGRDCVMEFRALEVPGEYTRVSFKLEAVR